MKASAEERALVKLGKSAEHFGFFQAAKVADIVADKEEREGQHYAAKCLRGLADLLRNYKRR